MSKKISENFNFPQYCLVFFQRLWNCLDKNKMYSTKLEAAFIDVLNKIPEDVIVEETAAKEEEESKHLPVNGPKEYQKTNKVKENPKLTASSPAISSPEEAKLLTDTLSYIRILRKTIHKKR